MEINEEAKAEKAINIIKKKIMALRTRLDRHTHTKKLPSLENITKKY